MISKRIENKVKWADDILNKINKPIRYRAQYKINQKIIKKKIKTKITNEVTEENIEYFNFYESLIKAIDEFYDKTSFNKNITFNTDNDDLKIKLKKEDLNFSLKDTRFEKLVNNISDSKLASKEKSFKFFNQDDFKNYNKYF